MKFDFYIRNQGEEKGQIEAISFKFKGKAQCSSDIRQFMGDEGQKSVHFRETSDTSRFQELLDRTVQQIGSDKGFNTKVTVDIPNTGFEIEHNPNMISAIYFEEKFIPTLETNSLKA